MAAPAPTEVFVAVYTERDGERRCVCVWGGGGEC